MFLLEHYTITITINRLAVLNKTCRMTASWLSLLLPSHWKELVLFGLIFLETGKPSVNTLGWPSHMA
jgi:hypothetical protein